MGILPLTQEQQKVLDYKLQRSMHYGLTMEGRSEPVQVTASDNLQQLRIGFGQTDPLVECLMFSEGWRNRGRLFTIAGLCFIAYREETNPGGMDRETLEVFTTWKMRAIADLYAENKLPKVVYYYLTDLFVAKKYRDILDILIYVLNGDIADRVWLQLCSFDATTGMRRMVLASQEEHRRMMRGAPKNFNPVTFRKNP